MIASNNVKLKVPFNEKDQAKSLGARWNAESKHWYVPQGSDTAPFEKWFTSALELQSAPSAAIFNVQSSGNSTVSFNDDIDVINAKLRDAVEINEIDLSF